MPVLSRFLGIVIFMHWNDHLLFKGNCEAIPARAQQAAKRLLWGMEKLSKSQHPEMGAV
ncbi:MAG: hypothetical protein HQL95_06720 [Magnetococcales bacterium]|nr:hypothetical protein [Magnetococcales bacterium]